MSAIPHLFVSLWNESITLPVLFAQESLLILEVWKISTATILKRVQFLEAASTALIDLTLKTSCVGVDYS